MFEFFNWIVSTVSALVGFVLQIIDGLFRLIGLIPVAVNVLTQSVGYLPSILAVFAGATITISVIFIIVGRQGGGDS